jgi:hypothetical protein
MTSTPIFSTVFQARSGEATEYRLTELGGQGVATIPAGPEVGQNLSDHLGQAEGVIEFTEREQPGAWMALAIVP